MIETGCKAVEAAGVGDLIDAVDEIGCQFGKREGLWFRGHSDRKFLLQPSLMRMKPPSVAYLWSTAIQFRNRGFALRVPPPAYDDTVSWLMLMQHYRCRTYLLDWSASPLVAAHFAVHGDSDDERTGEVCVLWPGHLNGTMTESKNPDWVCLPEDPTFGRPFFDFPFRPGSKLDINVPIAIEPPYVDIRMQMQQARFTAHPRSRALETYDDAPKYLARVLLSDKLRMRRELRQLGFGEAGLFPDLDHLSNEIVSHHDAALPASNPLVDGE